MASLVTNATKQICCISVCACVSDIVPNRRSRWIASLKPTVRVKSGKYLIPDSVLLSHLSCLEINR